ncbi:MAG: efflux RND transporter permease subunit, partial [Planctomycetales bacterium]|nr:efflux RND transporter permease subunit [Planctomycetales bacterium]
EEGIGVAFSPPSIDGLGVASGFQMQLQDKRQAGLTQLEDFAVEIVQDGNAQSGLTALNTTFRANTPQLFADVDRQKVKSLDVPLSSVFGTLQAYLGSAYVNDFNRFGRTYQVMIQADQQFRLRSDDILALDVRNRHGDMLPMGTFVQVEETLGPQVIQRYNMYPSAQINGEPAPGYSSGQAIELMEQMAGAKLPDTMGYEWTGMSYQEQQAGGQTIIFVLAVLCVFLVLAFQYESWTSPAAVVAVVPLAALGVVISVAVARASIDTYTQIGIVLLVALASKNAILIVEFASEQRRSGESIRDSAQNAAALRFRAILMTAFSSILGFLPLLTATGAGAASRVAVGLAVVGGMTAATFFALMFVPSFFVLFQSLSEWNSSSDGASQGLGPQNGIETRSE